MTGLLEIDFLEAKIDVFFLGDENWVWASKNGLLDYFGPKKKAKEKKKAV